MSSDKTSDIARHFSAAFDRHVQHVDCHIFWGTNSTEPVFTRFNAHVLRASPSSWKNETLCQLQELKRGHPDISHVVVFLDDFIVTRDVDFRELSPILSDAAASEIDYLRLRPLEESVLVRSMWRLRRGKTLGDARCIRIRRTHPYYSSLQVALWALDYLMESIARAGDIWHFEQRVSDAGHYAVTRPLLRYRHVVEKGIWDFGAEAVCREHAGFFDPGARAGRTGALGALRKHVSRLRFEIGGYAPMRIKRALGAHRSSVNAGGVLARLLRL